MNILQVSPYYKPAYVYGGPIVSISHLADNLHLNGHQITVYTTNSDENSTLPFEPGIRHLLDGYNVVYFKLSWIKTGFLSIGLLWNLYKNCRSYDIVHIHTWWNFVSILAVAICYVKGVKPILSPRGMLSNYSFSHRKSSLKMLFHRFAGKFLLSNTMLHATSLLEAEECLQLLPNWSFFIAPNFIFFSTPYYSASPPKPTKKIRLVFLSRIHEKKGLDILFRALSTISFPFELSVIGKGDEDYISGLKILTKDLGIDSSVFWYAWAGESEKYEYLSNADVMVLPSHNENFANVVLEALSVGTPVLLSKNVGLSDYVQKNNLGWVVNLDVLSISDGLTQLYTDQSKRDYIRLHAPNHIRNDFAPKTVVKLYLNAYASI